MKNGRIPSRKTESIVIKVLFILKKVLHFKVSSSYQKEYIMVGEGIGLSVWIIPFSHYC